MVKQNKDASIDLILKIIDANKIKEVVKKYSYPKNPNRKNYKLVLFNFLNVPIFSYSRTNKISLNKDLYIETKTAIREMLEENKILEEHDSFSKEITSNNAKITYKLMTLRSDLESANKVDKEIVKSYENMYRKCTDDFYKKSYRRTIDMANARREVRNQILSFIEKGEQK